LAIGDWGLFLRRPIANAGRIQADAGIPLDKTVRHIEQFCRIGVHKKNQCAFRPTCANVPILPISHLPNSQLPSQLPTPTAQLPTPNSTNSLSLSMSQWLLRISVLRSALVASATLARYHFGERRKHSPRSSMRNGNAESPYRLRQVVFQTDEQNGKGDAAGVKVSVEGVLKSISLRQVSLPTRAPARESQDGPNGKSYDRPYPTSDFERHQMVDRDGKHAGQYEKPNIGWMKSAKGMSRPTDSRAWQ